VFYVKYEQCMIATANLLCTVYAIVGAGGNEMESWRHVVG